LYCIICCFCVYCHYLIYKNNIKNAKREKTVGSTKDVVVDTIVEVENALQDNKFNFMEGLGLTDNVFKIAGTIRTATKADWNDFDILDADIALKTEQIVSRLRIEKHLAHNITMKSINILERIISLIADLKSL